MFQMVIANRLHDGLVVFLAADGRWVESIADGGLTSTDEAANALLERALREEGECHVIDPYLIEVTSAEGTRRPVVYREAIRALGPTVAAEAG
jgi:hypothetical protein